MLKLLRNLLKSPMFVIGISIFVLTLTCSVPTTSAVTTCRS